MLPVGWVSFLSHVWVGVWGSEDWRMRLVASLGGESGTKKHWVFWPVTLPASFHGCPLGLRHLCPAPHPGFSVL